MNGENILGRLPGLLPREDDSVFRRYVDAFDEEVEEEYEDAIIEIKLSRQIDNAEGDNLDRLGRLFGPIGRRRGREDDEYRTYLRSIVPVFSGRGQKHAIRNAVAAALAIDVDDVTIDEDFENVEYTIVLTDWPDHAGTTIEDIADIADASGVRQSDTRYELPDIQTTVAVDSTATSGQQILVEQANSVEEITFHIDIAAAFDVTEIQEQLDLNIGLIGQSQERWDIAVWDNFEWDGLRQVNNTAADDTVEVEVTDV